MFPIYWYRPAIFEKYRINPKPLPYSFTFLSWSAFRVVIVNNLLVGFPGFAPIYFQWSRQYNVFDVDLDRFPSYASIGALFSDAFFVGWLS